MHTVQSYNDWMQLINIEHEGFFTLAAKGIRKYLA